MPNTPEKIEETEDAPSHLWSDVSAATVAAAVDNYENHVGSDLAEIEYERWEKIPETVRQRNLQGGAYITKREMMTLVEWKSKQKNSPYRMKLIKLADGNENQVVEQTSRNAFSQAEKDPSLALQTLTSMAGIGPATASLLLSSCNPEQLPFFSDPLFRWLHLEQTTNGALKGWDRPIKYSFKEYESLYDRIEKLRARLREQGSDISATKIEKAALAFSHTDIRTGGTAEKGPNKRKLNQHPEPQAKFQKRRSRREGISGK